MSLACRVAIAALSILAWPPGSASAHMLIYLDLDGHAEPSYDGQSIAVGAFTGGPASREEVVRRLREDFAPFDVTFVTSDDLLPGELPPGIGQGFTAQAPAIRVAIGGTVADLGANGRATDPHAHNAVWVAEFNGTARRTDREIANTASHELGHAFGFLAAQLQPWANLKTASTISHYAGTTGPNDTDPFHQSTHDLTAQGKTQIMGGARAVVRDIWWRDPNVAKALRAGGNEQDPNDWLWDWQDDILSVAGAVGLRPGDDHPDSPRNGSPMTPFTGSLPPDETRLDASGTVEMNAASWPGSCPPVPLWIACPPYEETYPPTGVDAQNVVFPLARDFFRFDVANTGPTPRLFVNVDTIDLRGSTTYAGNLDVDLEVWFNDPVSGWTDITAQGVRGDGATDPWARWTTVILRNGQYAIGVKSHGGYGDLGAYHVHALGTDGTRLAAAPQTGLTPVEPLDVEALITLIAELRSKADLFRLVAGLAESGMVAGPGHGESKTGWPLHRPPSKAAVALVTNAMKQTSALRVTSGVVAWGALSKEEAATTYQRLAKVLARFDARTP
jgi:hypothetical protein